MGWRFTPVLVFVCFLASGMQALEVQLAPAPVSLAIPDGYVPSVKSDTCGLKTLDGKALLFAHAADKPATDGVEGIPKRLYHPLVQTEKKDASWGGQVGTLLLFAPEKEGKGGCAVYKFKTDKCYFLVARWQDDGAKKVLLGTLEKSRAFKDGDKSVAQCQQTLKKFQEEALRISIAHETGKGPEEFGRLLAEAVKADFGEEKRAAILEVSPALLACGQVVALLGKAREECKAGIEGLRRQIKDAQDKMDQEKKSYDEWVAQNKKDDKARDQIVKTEKRQGGFVKEETKVVKYVPDEYVREQREQRKKQSQETIAGLQKSRDDLRRQIQGLNTSSEKIEPLAEAAESLLGAAGWAILSGRPIPEARVFLSKLQSDIAAYCQIPNSFGGQPGGAVASTKDSVQTMLNTLEARKAATKAAEEAETQRKAQEEEARKQAELAKAKAEAEKAKAEAERAKAEEQRKAEEAKLAAEKAAREAEEKKQRRQDLLTNGPKQIADLEAAIAADEKAVPALKAELEEISQKVKEADAFILSAFTDRQRTDARLKKAELVEAETAMKGKVETTIGGIAGAKEKIRSLKEELEKAKTGKD